MHYLLIQASYLNKKKLGGTLKLLCYNSGMPVENYYVTIVVCQWKTIMLQQWYASEKLLLQ
jgi:hypothetical protein